MLAIWSRTKQKPKTCKCVSRAPKATAVARRGPFHSWRSSWTLGTPVSSFAYTTAATGNIPDDARSNRTRNKQWNDVLAPLKEALSREGNVEKAWQNTAGRTAHADKSPAHRKAMTFDGVPNNLDWAAVERVAGMELSEDDVVHDDYALTSWEALNFDSKLPEAQTLEWPANTGPPLTRYNLPPQSLWALDSMRLTAMRKRHTWKKLAIQKFSTGLLVHRLINRTNFPMLFHAANSDLNTLSPPLRELASFTNSQAQRARKEILKAIEQVQVINVSSSVEEIEEATPRVNQPAIPSYFQDADGDFHAICEQMNEAINKLLHQIPEGSDRNEGPVVAKICHNLLVSTASPDLRTFNLLLSGFKRWRRPKLVDDVIAAFLVQKIRPNEITCREILGHYASESRPDDFSRFVARMRGVEDALMLANPNISPIHEEVSQGRLVRVSKDKVYQKVYPTPMVFDALVGGALKFAGFDRALDIYYELKADGWGLDVHGLTRLLRDCIRRADWEGGTYLWEEISTIKWNANPRDMARAYYHMLSLCSITGNTVPFNQILKEVVKRGYDRKSIINAATKTALQVRKTSEYLAPAWAADNVLIAVSDYINDANPGGGKGVPPLEGFESESLFDEQAAEQTGSATQEEPADAKEAWASWIEKEFGERPKDPEL